MNECTNGHTYLRKYQRTNERTDRRTNERTDGWKDRQERADGWTERQTKQRTYERTDGGTQKRTNKQKSECGKTRETTAKTCPSFESSVRAVFFDAATFPFVFPFPLALALVLRLQDDAKSWQIGTEYSIRKKKYLVA